MAQPLTVASPSAAVERMAPDWALVGSLLGGTRAMREAGQAYLPKWPKEDDESYKARLRVSVLFPAYARTVATLAAKPFSSPVTIGEDVPERIRELLDDIDLQGRNIDRFAADVFEGVTGYGLQGILVDFPDASDAPTTEAGIRTQAAERAAGLRPYWVHIRAEQILGWRAAMVRGSWQLQMLRLMETVEEPDGEFDARMVDQVRVLEPGRWRLFREVTNADGQKEWQVFREGVTTLDFVPFVPCYGRRMDFMIGRPPLIEVAHLNVAHWQSASDQQNILHVARVPLLVAKNVADPVNGAGEVVPWELRIGAGAAVRINGQDAELRYVEHTGAAIKAGADDLKDLEERMRQAGAELLVMGQTQKTRVEAQADDELAMCALQRMALAFEDALDLALAYTARWLGLAENEGGRLTLFKDFGAATLAEASAQLLLDMATAGKLSDETLHSELKRRGVLSADVDHEEEMERLGGQGPGLGTLGQGGEGDPEDDDQTPSPAPPAPVGQPGLQPLDLSPVVAAIEAGMQALQAAMPAPAAPVDLSPLLAAIAAMQPAQITVTAPPADLTPVAAAIAALQPPQVTITSADHEALGGLVQTVQASVQAVTAAAASMTALAAELPGAVAAAVPSTIQTTVEAPRRTATARFTTDAAGNITGATLTDD